jgi:antitoxin component YwqK of YwqJK toxin-antitoxin module
MVEVFYINGKAEGLAKDYYENGKVMREVIFENGKIKSGFFYKQDGTKSKMSKLQILKLGF